MIDLRFGEPQSRRSTSLDNLPTDAALTRYTKESVTSLRGQLADVLGVSEGHVAVTLGATTAIASLFELNRPSTVWVPTPGYAGYLPLLPNGVVLRRYGYKSPPTVDQVAPGECVVINTPHNPTGFRVSESRLDALVSGYEDAGVDVIVDAVYERFDSEIWTRKSSNLATVGSFSKIVGVPGLRCGFVVCGERLVESLASWTWSRFLGLPGPTALFAESLLADWQLHYNQIQTFALEQGSCLVDICETKPGVSFVFGLPVPFGLLIASDRAVDLEARLAQAGIFVSPLSMMTSRHSSSHVCRVPLATSEADFDSLRVAVATMVFE